MIIIFGKKSKELFKQIQEHIKYEEVTFEQSIQNAKGITEVQKKIKRITSVIEKIVDLVGKMTYRLAEPQPAKKRKVK